jgi:nucleotide-binding universal stress UspA family protein
MSYKTILVHIDDSRCSGARVDFAVDLALKHNAHLIGLYVVCRDPLRPFLKPDESLNLAVHEAQARARLERVHEPFYQRRACPLPRPSGGRRQAHQ